MNALEFYAHVEKYGGITEDGEEVVLRLSKKYDEELQYFAQYSQDDKFYYEYLTLTPRQDRKYLVYYTQLTSELVDLPTEKQYEILKRMETIEMKYSPDPDYDELNGWYLHHASYQKYPLFSLRGTCNVEKDCSCDCSYNNIHGRSCCSDKKVGCSDASHIKYPYYYEILTDLVLWMVSCPNVDALYVMHD